MRRKLVEDAKPLIEDGGCILQECNCSVHALDPDVWIATTVKARAPTREATPERYQLTNMPHNQEEAEPYQRSTLPATVPDHCCSWFVVEQCSYPGWPPSGWTVWVVS